MPIGDPWDGFFYPTLALMVDSYILASLCCPYEESLKYWLRCSGTCSMFLCLFKLANYWDVLVHSSNSHDIVSSLISRLYYKLIMEFLNTTLQMPKTRVGLGGGRAKLLHTSDFFNNLKKIFSFQLPKTLESSFSRLHQSLLHSSETPAISS